MKRDMDLVRAILLAIESHDDPNKQIDIRKMMVDTKAESGEQLMYHIKLLVDAGFVEALDATTAKTLWWLPESLTWRGHEFLDNIRDDTVWNKTKETVGSKVSSVSLAVIQEVAKSIVKTVLGLP